MHALALEVMTYAAAARQGCIQALRAGDSVAPLPLHSLKQVLTNTTMYEQHSRGAHFKVLPKV